MPVWVRASELDLAILNSTTLFTLQPCNLRLPFYYVEISPSGLPPVLFYHRRRQGVMGWTWESRVHFAEQNINAIPKKKRTSIVSVFRSVLHRLSSSVAACEKESCLTRSPRLNETNTILSI